MFAGAMAALMVLSAVNVSGWGVMNAKAEESTEITLAENAPQYLYVGDNDTIAVISDGKLQDDGKDNKNTIYQGNGWYYDSEENQLVLQGVMEIFRFCYQEPITWSSIFKLNREIVRMSIL